MRKLSFGRRAGIVTSLLVALLGQARIYVVLGRARLLPPWLAQLHSTRQTPVHATAFTGFTAGQHAAGLAPSLVCVSSLLGTVRLGTMASKPALLDITPARP